MAIPCWKWLIVAGISIMVSVAAQANKATDWRTLAPGLEYTQISGFRNFPQGHVHAFRIDLKHYYLKSIAMVNDDNPPADNFQQLMRMEQAVLASNGGFFTSALKPVGLRINQNQLFSSFKPISWWGTLVIWHQQAYLLKSQNYHLMPAIDFAIQAGPLLVMAGQVMPHLSTKLEFRTALGITSKQNIILAATQDLLLSTAELAALMARPIPEGGLDCVSAINLDGGSSTQLYTNLAEFSLYLSSRSHVADAVLVVPRVGNDQ